MDQNGSRLNGGGARLKLAYLCAQYPAVSHTFVLREVQALRRRGAEIATFSVRRASAEHLLAAADEEAYRSTVAILPPRWPALIRAHLRLLARSPRLWARTLAGVVRRSPPGLRGRVWQAFYFMEAVVLWEECERRGLRHIHVHLANVAADVASIAAEIGTAAGAGEEWSWSFSMHGPTELFDVERFQLAEKLRRARFVICISDFTRSQLMSLCEPEHWEKLRVIHVGIPIGQFTDDGAARREQEVPTVLFVGRQVPEKGQGVLLEAMRLLAERGVRARATLAGEGAARADLERLAEQLGVDSLVSFPGAVGQDDIHDLYARAAIFCLPSFAEGVPGTLMEAMSMEVPVVSTRIAGIPELIEDGRTGLLVSPGRADELADALERLLTDAELCRELGRAGREKVVREFNTESSADYVHALFAEQLSANGGRR
jgi:colanic acid/amylovoran biosynthesis glycosyltransferase